MLKNIVYIILIAVIFLNTAGCCYKKMIIPKQPAIEAYIKDYPDLPELDKACIYESRFEVGMRAATVRFLLGEPDELSILTGPWGNQERWVYRQCGERIFYMEGAIVVGMEEL